ncbi:MAG TPA: HAD family hydrolase [Streptomyces sp.]|uniref:HAD family hydrolase n=1 Tax=Streptomyces sp. TaxID=1931 RepID=UPI002D5F3808|nr:HAD family hydrolase [Streptomyces sp.]HZG06131.1 HAD family hydrolase [Streptomyces sp.]
MVFAAVVFDFFGTLTPSTPARVWDEHAARSAAPLGIPARTWRAALDDSFPERAVGALGGLRETFRTLARRCGVEPDEAALTAACEARRAAQEELFVLREDAPATVEGIRARGLRVGVLSDCTVELAERWPTLPLASRVDAAVLSCLEGRRKPDPGLFDRIASRLGVEPRRCLYVGDGGGDELEGAAACGMTAVLLWTADQADNASDKARARKERWSGPRVASLSQVLSVLDGPSALPPPRRRETADDGAGGEQG